MRKTVLLASALFVACSLTVGCGSSGSPAETANIMNEVTEILVTIKDKPTADAAKPKLTAAGEKMKKHNEAMAKKYPAPTSVDISKMPTMPTMPEADQKKMTEAMTKYFKEIERVSAIDGGPEALMAYGEASGNKLPKGK